MLHKLHNTALRVLALSGLLLAAIGLASCSGSSGPASLSSGQPAVSGGPGAETANSMPGGLPPVAELSQFSRRASELVSTPDQHISPQSPAFISSGVNWGSGESALYQSAPGLSTYALYSIGELHPNDRLLSLSVTADEEEIIPGFGGPPPFEYYVLLADFNSGRWLPAPVISTVGTQALSFPVQSGLVSSSGYIYIAVLTYGGTATHLTSIDASLDISARAVDHVLATFPAMDSSGVNIAYQLQAVDSNDAVVSDFNGTALLTSNPADVESVLPVEFVNGVCSPLMMFHTAGTYELALTGGVIPALNGPLGSMEVYSTQLPVYSIFIDPVDLQYLIDNPWDDTYHPGAVTFNGKSYPTVDLRFRGDSARWLWKKNWKVKLPKGSGYDDTEWGYSRHELNLNAECVDPTMMREMLSYTLMQDMGMLAPRARFIHLRVNNVFQGVYCDVEDPNKQLIAFHGVNDGGCIYKPSWCIMDVQGDGSGPAYVGPFEKKTREAEPYDDLALLISNINNVWNPADCSDAFKASFDEEGFLKYMVANCLCSDGDQLGKNFILYNEDIETGQWMIIPWDYDLTWGHHYTGEYGLFCQPMFMDTPLDMGGYNSTYAGWRGINNLLDRYVYDPILWDEYRARLATDMDIYFREADQIARIDQYYNLIKDDAHADTQRWVFGTYEERVQELRDYVVARRAFLSQQLGL